jgi:hypothetical protein
MEIIEKSQRKHEITVNSNLNKVQVLITLIHEISHLVAFEKFEEILNLMVMNGVFFSTVNDPYIRPEIFPSQLPLL